MKYRHLILITLLFALTGCNKDEQVSSNSITLTPPKNEEIIIHSANPQPMEVEEKEIEDLEIKSRTKIMINNTNSQSYVKKDIETVDVNNIREETPILSRFRENISNIKFPKNYRIIGDIKNTDKSTSISISKMSSGELYVSINYDNILLEQFTPNDDTDIKDVYIISNIDGDVIEGKALSYSAVDITTYEDFKILSIIDVVESGNNYKVNAVFNVDNQQVNGTLIVSENMNVHSIKYNHNNLEYDLKVQTLLKLPKTINQFQMNNITTEQMDLYTTNLHNAFVTRENELSKSNTTPIVSSIPQGYIDTKENVDVELDDKGNIIKINTIKEYTYPNGDTLKEITVKDKDGNIIETKLESHVTNSTTTPEESIQNEPTEEITKEDITDTSVIEHVLRPVIKIDENILANELEDKLIRELLQLDSSLGINYKVVMPEDPTTITMDISYVGEDNRIVLEKFLYKFAEDNYTIILGWR